MRVFEKKSRVRVFCSQRRVALRKFKIRIKPVHEARNKPHDVALQQLPHAIQHLQVYSLKIVSLSAFV